MDKKLTYQKVVTAVCMLVSLFAVIIHVGNYTTFTMPVSYTHLDVYKRQ